MNTLGEILSVALSSEIPEDWLKGIKKLGGEREKIIHFLVQERNHPVYGFNTLLGHLDGHFLNPKDQGLLLERHLVGSTFQVPAFFYRLLSASQMTRLLKGGTGVSKEALAAIRTTLKNPSDKSYYGAWSASYSSGDVVPGAWWVRNLLAETDAELKQGDLIALMSGNWVSSSWALLALLCAMDYFSGLMAALQVTARKSPHHNRQLPISLRDIQPFKAAFSEALFRVKESLISRYSHPSGNPIFQIENNNVTAQSQNSYLDFGLTFSLTALLQALHLAIGLWQRLIQHASNIQATERPIQHFVQPAKVAQAEVQKALLVAGSLPANFTGAESEGIEDVRDLSLDVSLQILRLLPYLDHLEKEWARLGIEKERQTSDDLEYWSQEILGDSLYDDAARKLVQATKDILLGAMES